MKHDVADVRDHHVSKRVPMLFQIVPIKEVTKIVEVDGLGHAFAADGMEELAVADQFHAAPPDGRQGEPADPWAGKEADMASEARLPKGRQETIDLMEGQLVDDAQDQVRPLGRLIFHLSASHRADSSSGQALGNGRLTRAQLTTSGNIRPLRCSVRASRPLFAVKRDHTIMDQG
ncbi:MAG TPA: hypothetical protein VGE68_07465 [Sphingomicrobium sp.]